MIRSPRSTLRSSDESRLVSILVPPKEANVYSLRRTLITCNSSLTRPDKEATSKFLSLPSIALMQRLSVWNDGCMSASIYRILLLSSLRAAATQHRPLPSIFRSSSDIEMPRSLVACDVCQASATKKKRVSVDYKIMLS
jgi:hypothetical protein